VSASRAALRSMFTNLPVAVSAMIIGAVVLGVLGGLVGLVVGLRTNPATAWFAVLEVGVPAGVVGWVLGLPVGLVAQWIARAPKDPAPKDPVDDDFAGGPRGW
jgi:hypothetical protein